MKWHTGSVETIIASPSGFSWTVLHIVLFLLLQEDRLGYRVDRYQSGAKEYIIEYQQTVELKISEA